ncbi:hypothetical protein [Microbulbifer sp. SSSA005]|uniref:hypothetical protein n=1 Tax=Microbulbifer sp. SSSA005 TaxID=3243378 RepID=UPI0040395013
MVYEIELDERLVGYAMSPVKPGEMAPIEYRGISFASSGRDFIRKAEGILSSIISKADENLRPWDVKTLVALIDQDQIAKVYLNEIELTAAAMVASKVSAGDPVRKSDLYHIDKLILKDIEFREDLSFVVLINNGWDRIFYFDFGPNLDGDKKKPIHYDVGHFLAIGFSMSLFFELFDLSDVEWRKVIDTGWFPFSFLSYEKQKTLLNSIKLGWPTDEIESDADEYFCENACEWIDRLKNNSLINEHIELIESALELHKDKRYDASIHMLYPRIEAILKKDFMIKNPDASNKKARKQSSWASHTATNITDHSHVFSRLFPSWFAEYVLSVFFKGFDSGDTPDFVSRNTVGHGVVNSSALTKKSSLVGFLILDQINLYTGFAKQMEIQVPDKNL